MVVSGSPPFLFRTPSAERAMPRIRRVASRRQHGGVGAATRVAPHRESSPPLHVRPRAEATGRTRAGDARQRCEGSSIHRRRDCSKRRRYRKENVGTQPIRKGCHERPHSKMGIGSQCMVRLAETMRKVDGRKVGVANCKRVLSLATPPTTKAICSTSGQCPHAISRKETSGESIRQGADGNPPHPHPLRGNQPHDSRP